jgi:signal transduction histidine kinase
VQEHGGSISAEANSPKGARFLLRLPLVEPANARRPACRAAPATKRSR